MINTVFNSMITLLLAKFMINDLPHAAKLLESNAIELRYWNEQVKEEVQSAAGLTEFILYHIGKLSAAHQRTPNYLIFEPQEGLASHTMAMLSIDPCVSNMWRMHEAETRKYLPWVIAHEYRHYLTIARGLKIPYPRGPKWVVARKAYEEEVADAFAEEYTGIPAEEARTAINKLWSKIE